MENSAVWFDLILLGIGAAVTWAVGSQGMGGAALRLFNVLLGGLLAMNFFEPVADLMVGVFGAGGDVWYDLWSIMLLFIVGVAVVRALTDSLSPLWIRFTPLLDQMGRWFFALWTGWLTTGFLMTAVHTAPLPREFLGFSPEKERFLFLNWRPDYVWLAYNQRCSEALFNRGSDGEHVFDAWKPPAGSGEAAVTDRIGSPTPEDAAHNFIARYATRRSLMYGATPPPLP